MSDQQRFKRISTELPMTWRTTFNGMIRNISIGGLYFNSATPPTVGDPLELNFQIPATTTALQISGIVRWVSTLSSNSNLPPSYGVGVEFQNPSGPDQDQLKNYIDAHQQLPDSANRRASRFEVEYRFSGQRFQTLATDISVHGIFLLSNDPLQLDDIVHLRFQLPGTGALLSVRGIVRWRHHEIPSSLAAIVPSGMGIEFTHLGAEERAIIEDFLNLNV